MHPQEAEGDSHDGGFVQVGGDSAGERQCAGELVKHLRLLTPPTSGRIPRTQLPLLRAGPAERRDTISRDNNSRNRGTKITSRSAIQLLKFHNKEKKWKETLIKTL